LTRFILTNPPPSQLTSGRKSKKSRSNQGEETTDESVGDRPPKLGTGLIVTQSNTSDPSKPSETIIIKAIIAGRLLYRPSTNTWFIASNPKRYHLSNSPSNTSHVLASTGTKKLQNKSSYGVGDRVLGIIEDQKASADYYKVNIFASHSALLHVLSFEGATKRNRPQLEPGCLIYCRIVKSFGGRMDIEVSCKVGGSGSGGVTAFNNDEEEGDDGGASRKDWLTNEGTYGPLTGGTSFRVSLGLARELLNPKNVVLAALDASKLPFEIAVGVNGMVWVNSPCAEYTIVVMNAIQNSEVMNAEQVRGMVKRMVKDVKKRVEDD
jgi:exosome complex component RRP40